MVNDIISVVMSIGENEKEENVSRTIDSLKENSTYKLEFIFLADGWTPEDMPDDFIVKSYPEKVGVRVSLNEGVELASGEYILRLDAHCSMSKGWDLELVKHCKDDTICVSVIDVLIEETWEVKKHSYGFVYINPSCEEKWWGRYPKQNKDIDCEPTMSFTGCGWLCKRNFYLKSLKLDEKNSKWGCLGPDLTLRAYKAGGSILLCKNVICGHVFNTNSSGYPISEVAKTRKHVLSRYSKYLYEAAKKFNAPGWENITEDYILNYERDFMYRTDVSKKVEQEVKDADGKVIRKIIKEYKAVPYNGKENPDIPEIGRKIAEGAEVKRIKIAELNEDNTWEFSVLESKNEIDLWLFENE